MFIETNNDSYQELLTIIYTFLINKKCAHLDLNRLEKIVVVSNEELSENVGSQYENGQISIREESIKNSFSCIKEKDINKYSFQEVGDSLDEKTKLLIDNVMHELFHCDAEKKMPTLHSLIGSNNEDLWKRCIARFWIECTVEYNSHKDSFLRKEKLLEHLSNIKWEIDSFWDNENEERTMYQLIYVASYFVSLNILYGTEEKYIENVGDKQIYDLYIDLFAICKKLLDKEEYIDDYNEIMCIENVFKDYFNNLNKKLDNN